MLCSKNAVLLEQRVCLVAVTAIQQGDNHSSFIEMLTVFWEVIC